MNNLLKQLTLPRLLKAIIFIGIFTMAVRVPADTDTWWHLRSGQYIVETQSIPLTDPFSHTRAGDLWIDHGWLAQIFWYLTYAVGGWATVSLALAVIVTASFWFVWKQIEANIFVAALSLKLGAIVSSVVWIARPQMVSFLLTAIIAYLLHRFKRNNGKLLPWVPLLMMLWANIHGGFAIGFMMMLAYLLGEAVNNLTGHQDDPVVDWAELRHLLFVFVISLLVVVINPHTWRLWVYPFQTVGIGALRDFIQEWQSPNFHLIHVQPFALMLLLVVAALGRAGQRADWTDLALVGMWAAWALFASRNIALFGLIVAPVLARYGDLVWTDQWQRWRYQPAPFSSVAAQRRAPMPVLNAILLGLIGVAALIKIIIPLTPQANLTAEQNSLPYDAVEFLRAELPPGPLFNSYNWGGYLIFKLWPAYPVYIDGRTDLYDDAFIRRYLATAFADDEWQQRLDDDQINLVLIEADGVLAKFMRTDVAWTEIYRDEMAVIYARQTALSGGSP